jgi:hypothetical protein
LSSHLRLGLPKGLFPVEFIYYFTYFSHLQHPKELLKCRINDERPTGNKHTTDGWDDGGKIGKIINKF